MADTATDIRTLIRSDRTQPDGAAIAHVLAGTIFLALGSAAAAGAFLSMAFPAFVPLGYGILRAMAMLSLVVGFATITLIGGVYYVLPRLTAVRLWNEQLAWVGLAIVAGTTGLGLIALGAGFGNGSEPFALPWWLDLPLLGGLAVPALLSLQTLRARTEHRSYVTVDYAVTALAALPLLYIAGNIPGMTSVATTLGNVFFASAYLVAGILLGAIGLLYYTVVKHTDQPLAGRQLAQVGYWSLLFGAGWFGVSQLMGGPIPIWLGAVAAVLGLAFPVGMAAVTANMFSTLEGQWRRSIQPDPVVTAAMGGLVLGLIVAVLAAIGGFRSTATLVAFTPFWEAVQYGLVMGVIPLLLGASLFHALPRMTGRMLFSADQGRMFTKLALLGSGGLVLFLGLAGIVTGYSWSGGSFTGGFAAIGEEWATASGPAAVFVGLAVIAGLVAVVANFSLSSLVIRTLTRGRATTQEVLVTAGEVES